MTAHRPTGERERIAVKSQKAMDLRVAGNTYTAIAKELSVSVSTAIAYVKRGLAQSSALTKQAADQWRSIQIERLESVILAIYPLAKAGNLDASAELRQLVAQECELLGLKRDTSGVAVGGIQIDISVLNPPGAKPVASTIVTRAQELLSESTNGRTEQIEVGTAA